MVILLLIRSTISRIVVVVCIRISIAVSRRSSMSDGRGECSVEARHSVVSDRCWLGILN